MTEGPRRSPDRRSDDTRLSVLERDLQRVLQEQEKANNKLDRLNDTMNAIQSEPQQFPAGRALLARADSNRERIDRHDVRIDSLEDWKSEVNGAAKFTRQVQLVLGIAIALITLYQLTRPA
jgi:chromosome segregation ATPase